MAPATPKGWEHIRSVTNHNYEIHTYLTLGALPRLNRLL